MVCLLSPVRCEVADRARNAIRSLLQLTLNERRCNRRTAVGLMPVTSWPSDRPCALLGERIALDGVPRRSSVVQAPITASATEKSVGDSVSLNH